MEHEVLITQIDMGYSPKTSEYLLIMYFREKRKKQRVMLKTRNNITMFLADKLHPDEYTILSINKRLKKIKGLRMILKRSKDDLKIIPKGN